MYRTVPVSFQVLNGCCMAVSCTGGYGPLIAEYWAIELISKQYLFNLLANLSTNSHRVLARTSFVAPFLLDTVWYNMGYWWFVSCPIWPIFLYWVVPYMGRFQALRLYRLYISCNKVFYSLWRHGRHSMTYKWHNRLSDSKRQPHRAHHIVNMLFTISHVFLSITLKPCNIHKLETYTVYSCQRCGTMMYTNSQLTQVS